jgi:hypothetical protein
MTTLNPPESQLPASEPQTATEEVVSSGITWLARFGYIAKGIIYIVIGILIFQLIVDNPALDFEFWDGDEVAEENLEAPDTDDVFWALLARPFGPFMLGTLAVGLGGYVLWRLVQAVRDTENKGSSLKGIAQRIAYVGMGVTYAGVMLTAIQVLLGLIASHEDGGALDDWTARVLGWSGGPWLVGLFGIAVCAVAVEELVRAHRTDLCEDLQVDKMHKLLVTAASFAGKFGISARGVIYGLIGIFLVQAAIEYEPEEVEGLGGALEWLALQPFGPALLGVIAAGLMAYGFYAIVEARYRYFNVD